LELKFLRKIIKLYYLILIKEEKSLLLLLVVKVDLGNTRFKSSTNRAPRKFTKGGIGEEVYNLASIKNNC
jgi:GTPase involved in cell partitioning and DNA repair